MSDVPVTPTEPDKVDPEELAKLTGDIPLEVEDVEEGELIDDGPQTPDGVSL